MLKYTGILEGELEPPSSPPQVVVADLREDYIMAPVSGLFEPFYELGEPVEAGQALGQIHSLEDPFREPQSVLAQTSGMLITRRSFPLTKQGDCIAALVRPFRLE